VGVSPRPDDCRVVSPPPPRPSECRQGIDLTVDNVGCGGELEFRVSNVGNEFAGTFTTSISFDLRTEDRENVGREAIRRTLDACGTGKESVNESVTVPPECFSQGVPIEQRGCDVFIQVDSKGEVKETDETNNSPFGGITCGEEP
jgi:CARDB